MSEQMNLGALNGFILNCIAIHSQGGQTKT